MLPWNGIFKRLMAIMDIGEPSTYFSGTRFIRKICEVDDNCPGYSEYIAQRNAAGLSTTRGVYFKDMLMALDEGRRIRVVNSILDDVEAARPDEAADIRRLLGGGTSAPMAAIPVETWSAERLNNYLRDIDAAIGTTEYDRAVTLSYTCLEGFYGAFVRAKDVREKYPNEIIELSKEVKAILKTTMKEYPDEVLNGITNAAYAIDKSRNRFSESHFAGEAGRWLAVYVRDLANTQIRLLLHFM
jgi:hypothetical protein